MKKSSLIPYAMLSIIPACPVFADDTDPGKKGSYPSSFTQTYISTCEETPAEAIVYKTDSKEVTSEENIVSEVKKATDIAEEITSDVTEAVSEIEKVISEVEEVVSGIEEAASVEDIVSEGEKAIETAKEITSDVTEGVSEIEKVAAEIEEVVSEIEEVTADVVTEVITEVEEVVSKIEEVVSGSEEVTSQEDVASEVEKATDIAEEITSDITEEVSEIEKVISEVEEVASEIEEVTADVVTEVITEVEEVVSKIEEVVSGSEEVTSQEDVASDVTEEVSEIEKVISEVEKVASEIEEVTADVVTEVITEAEEVEEIISGSEEASDKVDEVTTDTEEINSEAEKGVITSTNTDEEPEVESGVEFVQRIKVAYENGEFNTFLENMHTKYIENPEQMLITINDDEKKFWENINDQNKENTNNLMENLELFAANNPSSYLGKMISEFLSFQLTEDEYTDLNFITNTLDKLSSSVIEPSSNHENLWLGIKRIAHAYKIKHTLLNLRFLSDDNDNRDLKTLHPVLDLAMENDLLLLLEDSTALSNKVKRSFNVYFKYISYEYNAYFISSLLKGEKTATTEDEKQVKNLMNEFVFKKKKLSKSNLIG